MRKAVAAIATLGMVLVLCGCGTKSGNLPATVATVNGERISADEYVRALNLRWGQELLKNMIEQRIIAQWAEKAGVAPTEEQIRRQIDDLKYDGQYDDQVNLVGKDALISELRFLQARINLARKYTKITDADLKTMYERMKPKFVHGPRKFVAAILSPRRDQIEKALKSLKEGRDFDEVAKQYTDRRYVFNPPLKTMIPLDQNLLGNPQLAKVVKSTRVGKVSGIVSLGEAGGATSYAIFKVLGEQGSRNSRLEDVKDLVANQVALQNSQFQPSFLRKLNERMKSADVVVNIEQFKDLPNAITNPPEPMGAIPAPQ